jgi:hypothetical protein
MQRIVIDNFGPIKHLDLPIRDLTLLIGPNAGGKSLVAKLAFFFNRLWEVLLEDFEYARFKGKVGEDHMSPAQAGYEAFLRGERLPKLFHYFFGQSTYENPGSEVKFFYTGEKSIKLTSQAGQKVSVTFSSAFSEGLAEVQRTLAQVSEEADRGKGFIAGEPVQKYVWPELQELFGFEAKVKRLWAHFIPSNRAAVNLYRNQFFQMALAAEGSPEAVFASKDPFLHRFFLEFFPSRAELFEELRARLVQLPEGERARFELFLERFRTIVKGNYRVSANGQEYLQVEGKKLPVDVTTAGQQSAARLLAHLAFNLYFQKSSLVSIEEPEAHLYPEAQTQMVEALALALNAGPGNMMVINTHSPYVLTAFDNLITAAETARERPEEARRVAGVVPKEMWIDYDRVSAVFLEDGAAQTGDEGSEPDTILDRERRSLSGSRFDRAASQIEKTFDRLLEIRYPVEDA